MGIHVSIHPEQPACQLLSTELPHRQAGGRAPRWPSVLKHVHIARTNCAAVGIHERLARGRARDDARPFAGLLRRLLRGVCLERHRCTTSC